MAAQRAGSRCEPRLYIEAEWASELQGEHHQISSLCRRCHRYQGKWYKLGLCVREKNSDFATTICYEHSIKVVPNRVRLAITSVATPTVFLYMLSSA